jgi:acetamidase/formamidase
MGPRVLTGPIWIEGAEPGDTLEVRIESVDLRQDWAYNAVRPAARRPAGGTSRTLQVLNIPHRHATPRGAPAVGL